MTNLKIEETTTTQPQETQNRDIFWDQYLQVWKNLENASADIANGFENFPVSGATLNATWRELSLFEDRLRNDPKIQAERNEIKGEYWKNLQIHIDGFWKNYHRILNSLESINRIFCSDIRTKNLHELRHNFENLLELAENLPQTEDLLKIIESIKLNIGNIYEDNHCKKLIAESDKFLTEIRKFPHCSPTGLDDLEKSLQSYDTFLQESLGYKKDTMVVGAYKQENALYQIFNKNIKEISQVLRSINDSLIQKISIKNLEDLAELNRQFLLLQEFASDVPGSEKIVTDIGHAINEVLNETEKRKTYVVPNPSNQGQFGFSGMEWSLDNKSTIFGGGLKESKYQPTEGSTADISFKRGPNLWAEKRKEQLRNAERRRGETSSNNTDSDSTPTSSQEP